MTGRAHCQRQVAFFLLWTVLRLTFDLENNLLIPFPMIPQKQWPPVDSNHVGRSYPINLSLLIKVIVLIDPIPHPSLLVTQGHMLRTPYGDPRLHLSPRSWSSHQIPLISPTFPTWRLSGTSLVLSLCSAFPSESSSFYYDQFISLWIVNIVRCNFMASDFNLQMIGIN